MIRSFSGRHLTEQMHDSVHYPSRQAIRSCCTKR